MSASSPPPRPKRSSRGSWIIAALVATLLILHHDTWFWEDDTLVAGIMPIGMFWHVCISIGATLTWALATKIAWPLDDSGSWKEDH